MDRFSALIVDDDAGFRESLGLLVAREGYEVREATSLEAARQRLNERVADVVLIDLSLPDGEGIELLRDDTIRAGSEFVVVTGNASVESAVQALRDGALDYLTKPLDRARLKSILAGVSRTRSFKLELARLRAELRELGRFGRLVGRTVPMQRLYDLAVVSAEDGQVAVSHPRHVGVVAKRRERDDVRADAGNRNRLD